MASESAERTAGWVHHLRTPVVGPLDLELPVPVAGGA